MKKMIIVLGALVLLFVAFFAGFSLGMDSTNESQKDAPEVVETDSVDNEETHELKARLDIKYMANMMTKEKTTKQLNDAPYVAYLVDSLGFALVRMSPDEWWRPGRKEFEGGGMKLLLRSEVLVNGRLSRSILIKCGEAWYYFVRLKEFGLQGPSTVARGKGLKAAADRDRLMISYDPSDEIEENFYRGEWRYNIRYY